MAEVRVWIVLPSDSSVDTIIGKLVLKGYSVKPLSSSGQAVSKGTAAIILGLTLTSEVVIDLAGVNKFIAELLEEGKINYYGKVVTGTTGSTWSAGDFYNLPEKPKEETTDRTRASRVLGEDPTA